MAIFGRNVDGLNLATDSLILGVAGLLDELPVGTVNQILTVTGGGVAWNTDPFASLIDDLTPQLGGALDAQNSFKIINLLDPTLDQDAATKIYVDSNISGNITSFKFTVPLNSNGNIDPIASTIPAGATILRVYINVGVADSTATLTIGTTAGGAEYAGTTTNDPSIVGLYVAHLFSTVVGPIRAIVAATNGDAGATADVVVEYKTA
jgi:hypothetical protein